MLLRSNVRAVKPIDDGSCRREFVVVQKNDIKRKVYDENGEFIREISDVSINRNQIPLAEKMHLGQTSEMYSIGVLQEAGVSLKPITNFDRHSLEQQSDVLDQIETLTVNDFEQLEN